MLGLLYARVLDAPLVWTDASDLGERTLLRPPGEWARAFAEPLQRVPRGATATRQAYYRPLQVVWLSALDAAFDSSPRAFRLGGLAVAAAALAAFAALAWRLFGSPGPALAAALLVAAHPVGIEALVWISGISEPLCALFCFLALALALSVQDAAPARARLLAALSLAALLAALLSKERAAVLPALLLAVLLSRARLPQRAGAPAGARRGALLVAAHAALVAGFFLLWRPAVLGGVASPLAPIRGDPWAQVVTAVASWPASLGWLFLPVSSSTNDAVRIATSPGDPLFLLGALLALGSAGLWLWLLRAGRPVAALGLAWVWIAFLPTAGLVPQLHPRGERYLWLSAFGASLLVVDLGRAALGPRRRVAAAGLAALAVAWLGWRTALRLPDWASTETLFRVELERDPGYREARFLLAAAALEGGRPAEAGALLEPLLFGSPAPGRASYLNLLASYELGCATQVHLGRPRRALELEGRAGPSVAASPVFQVCLGEAREQLGDPAGALVHYRAALVGLGAGAPPPLRERMRELEGAKGSARDTSAPSRSLDP